MAAPRRENTAILILILVFIVGAVWVYFRFAKPEEVFPARSTMSPKRNGCMAVFELLEELEVPVERYSGNEYHYPTDGCMVVVDSSFADATMMLIGSLNMKQLSGWIEDGGRLVLASEADTMTIGYNLFEELDGRTPSDLFDFDPALHTNAGNDGLAYPPAVTGHFSSVGGEGKQQALIREYMAGEQFALPADRPVFWQDVEVFEIARNDYYWGGSGEVLLASSPPDSPVVMYRQFGEGEVYWITCPELVTNDWIDRGDNHRIVLGLLARASRCGTVYFDERIHGFRESGYNAGSLITKTLGGRLILLFAVAVILLFSGWAVRPAKFYPQPTPPRRQASEMVLAQADLYRRAKLVDSIARLLIDGLKRSYMKAAHLATPPDDRQLGAAIEVAKQNRGAAGQYLHSYLTGGVLPANPKDLLKLAQACYAAQGKL